MSHEKNKTKKHGSLFREEFDRDKSQDCQEGKANKEQVIVEHCLLLGPGKLIHGEGRAQRLKDSKNKQDDEEEKDTNDGCQAIIRLLCGCGHAGANTGVHIGGSEGGRWTAKRTWNIKREIRLYKSMDQHRE